jgi:hypothetical protein
LEDVGENDGPLTILPAEKSLWFRRQTGRRLGTPPLKQDDEFYRYFTDDDLVPLVGPAGTVGIVDTTNCMHYGSRCRMGGARTTFSIHYTRFADYSRARTAEYRDLNLATSPECRASLRLSPISSLAYRIVEAQN